MKRCLTGRGWVLPALSANLRNQNTISSIEVKSGHEQFNRKREIAYPHDTRKHTQSDALDEKHMYEYGTIYEMTDFIKHLKSGSTVAGEVPTLVKVKERHWPSKKLDILKHVIELMGEKNNKNAVILHDSRNNSQDIQNELMKITTKTIVTYPAPKNKQQNKTNSIKQFFENGNHILVTRQNYFNGCEASNVIYITSSGYSGMRSSFMRAVENLIVVQLLPPIKAQFTLKGFKEENKFMYDFMTKM